MLKDQEWKNDIRNILKFILLLIVSDKKYTGIILTSNCMPSFKCRQLVISQQWHGEKACHQPLSQSRH